MQATNTQTWIHECMHENGIGPCADSERNGGHFPFSNKNFVRITADFRRQTNETCVICEYWRLHSLNAFNFQQSISKHSRDAWCHLPHNMHRPNLNKSSIVLTFRLHRSTDANNAPKHLQDGSCRVPLHRHNIINENPKTIRTNNKDNTVVDIVVVVVVARSFNGVIAANETEVCENVEVYSLNVWVHNDITWTQDIIHINIKVQIDIGIWCMRLVSCAGIVPHRTEANRNGKRLDV